MRFTKRLLAALIVGVALVPLQGTAAAAQDPDPGIAGIPYATNEGSDERGWDDLRSAGERACKQAVDSAASLGEQLDDLQRHLSRTLVVVSGELTRSAARGMDELAGRLHDLAERMERPAE